MDEVGRLRNAAPGANCGSASLIEPMPMRRRAQGSPRGYAADEHGFRLDADLAEKGHLGIERPAIWTAGRDRAMWAALRGSCRLGTAHRLGGSAPAKPRALPTRRCKKIATLPGLREVTSCPKSPSRKRLHRA